MVKLVKIQTTAQTRKRQRKPEEESRKVRPTRSRMPIAHFLATEGEKEAELRPCFSLKDWPLSDLSLASYWASKLFRMSKEETAYRQPLLLGPFSIFLITYFK